MQGTLIDGQRQLQVWLGQVRLDQVGLGQVWMGNDIQAENIEIIPGLKI